MIVIVFETGVTVTINKAVSWEKGYNINTEKEFIAALDENGEKIGLIPENALVFETDDFLDYSVHNRS